MVNIRTNTFEEAFKQLNEQILLNYEFINDSRIGKTREITNIGFEVSDPSSYEFKDPRINRIKYDYADSFYNWMMEGGTTAPKEVTKHLSKEAGLSVIYNDAEYDRGRLVSPSRSYIGKVDRKQATKDDILSNLTF